MGSSCFLALPLGHTRVAEVLAVHLEAVRVSPVVFSPALPGVVEVLGSRFNLLLMLKANYNFYTVAELQQASSDELEKLYKSLEKASLSPLGERKPSTKRDFRKSFIRRCKNQSINEKLHKIRALNSTLKAKEADLLTIDQVLNDNDLTAEKYRQWKETNFLMLQEICQYCQPENNSHEDAESTDARPAHYTETDV
ncbi:ICEF1 protein, partial [Polypterus senegalus]